VSFQAPLFLAGLALVPVAIALTWLARRRAARYVVRLPSVPVLAPLLDVAPRWRRVLPGALLCAAAAVLVGALARPEATVAVPVERASVMLVTDTSGSMNATDVEPSRLQAARDAAGSFLDSVPDELQVGLVAFAQSPRTVIRPTDEHDAVRATVDGLDADGGTSTGDALQAALSALPKPGKDGKRAPAAVVLLSDGATTSGADPVEVARRAKTAGVPVYTVALGTTAGTVQQPDGTVQSVPPDPRALGAIASTSGGQAFAAEDAGQLEAVYERLGSQIGTRQEPREVTAAFAAAGLLLLVGGVGASLRFSGRLP
jgi:Ca-activated chloride channel homolog